MRGAVRFAAIGVLAMAFAAVWACSSSTTTRSGSAGTTTAAAAPATPVASEPSTAPSTARTGETGTMSGTVAGAATAAAGAAGLTDTLGSSLGLTGDQASGAVGSVLSLAQEKLPASDYTKVAGAVPGADSYVQKAKDLGAVSGPVSDAAGLSSAYSKLGISPEVGAKVTPVIVNYIGKAGGPTVQSLLSSVVK